MYTPLVLTCSNHGLGSLHELEFWVSSIPDSRYKLDSANKCCTIESSVIVMVYMGAAVRLASVLLKEHREIQGICLAFKRHKDSVWF